MNNSSSDRIVAELRTWIEAASPGAQLPSTRALVARHEASPVTVQQALRILTQQGVIESRPGVGTFVRGVPSTRPSDYSWQTTALGAAPPGVDDTSIALRDVPSDTIALHSGYPENGLLPERLVRTALTRAARGPVAVTRSPAAGLPDLQQWFAMELSSQMANGVSPPTPSDVTILPGSQAGLSSIFRALAGPGGTLVIESPTYWGAVLAAAQVGVQLIPVRSGPDGPDATALEDAFRRSGARAFYAQPNFANPTGARWSAALSEQVLEIATAFGAFVIEDDWAHDFGITADPTPLAARDDQGHVVYVRSLTKSVSPAVRVAGLIARGPARNRIRADVQSQAMYVSGVLQAAALDVVTQPGWRTYQRFLRRHLTARRDALVDALGAHTPSAYLDLIPSGGLHLWARLPDDVDPSVLTLTCEARGVLVAGGKDWFPAEPIGCYIRLNFSGPNPAAFVTAARTLESAIAQSRPHSG